MDIDLKVSERWMITASAFQADRPKTVARIEDNIGVVASRAVVAAGQVLNTPPRVQRQDLPLLPGEQEDVMITVYAPWPVDLDEDGLRIYMFAVRDETIAGLFDHLHRDRPRLTVRVRLVKEFELTVRSDE